MEGSEWGRIVFVESSRQSEIYMFQATKVLRKIILCCCVTRAVGRSIIGVGGGGGGGGGGWGGAHIHIFLFTDCKNNRF